MDSRDTERNQLIDEAVEHIAALHEDPSGLAHENFARWVRGSAQRVEAVLIATAQLRELARLDALLERVTSASKGPCNDESI